MVGADFVVFVFCGFIILFWPFGVFKAYRVLRNNPKYMKKFGVCILSFMLLCPLFANAGMVVWTATITIISNAAQGDSVFHYQVTQRGAMTGDFGSFDNSTNNGRADTSLTVMALPGVYYDIIQNTPEGWQLDEVVCVNNGGVNYSSYPIQNGISLVLPANASVSCSFNNSKVSQSKVPLLIVPGIMGTEIYKGEEILWPDTNRMVYTKDDRFMDSLGYKEDSSPLDTSMTVGSILGQPSRFFDYSKALSDDLVSQGYEPGKTLFTFPYDWRKDLSEIATQNLSGQIDYILNQTSAGKTAGKVDVIAHSQGGLVVKSLLYLRPEYQSKVNKLVFVGTPNLGAPKAAKALLYGDSMGVELLNLGLDPDEVKTIGRNMPSIYQLLPSEQYFNSNSGYLGEGEVLSPDMPLLHVKTLNFAESKQYLKDESLNSALVDQAGDFHTSAFDNFDFQNTGIKTYNIVGCQAPTISKIIQKPDGNYNLDYSAGDETVPIFSASNLPGALNFYALESSHGQMLTQDGIRQQILSIITDSSFPTNGKITPFLNDCVFNGHKISVHSPVDLHIYDAAGNHAGPVSGGGFENNLPGVGYDMLGHEKFAFLPSGGEYVVKLKATNFGEFSFYSSQVNNGEISSTAYYNQIPVKASSTAEIIVGEGSNQAMTLDLLGDGQVEKQINPSAVLTSQQSQDFIPPQTTAEVQGEQGLPGFYRGNVKLSLKATDPAEAGKEAESSGVLEVLYRKLGENSFLSYQSPLVFSQEGSQELEYYSVDKAGNREAIKKVSFVIDRTPPEYVVTYDLDKNNFNFQALDEPDSKITVVCRYSDCLAKDFAGNTSRINFDTDKDEGERRLNLSSIFYNQKLVRFRKTEFGVEVEKKKDKIKEFRQSLSVGKKEFVEIEYDSKKEVSIITRRDEEGKKIKTKEAGMKFLVLTTQNGKVVPGLR